MGFLQYYLAYPAPVVVVEAILVQTLNGLVEVIEHWTKVMREQTENKSTTKGLLAFSCKLSLKSKS